MIRFMCDDDVDVCVLIEAEAFSVMDPEFEVLTVGKDAWNRQDIIKYVQQSYNLKAQEFDTRAMVIEYKRKIIGYFIYELRPLDYQVNKLTLKPGYINEEVLHDVIEYMIKLTDKPGMRKRVEFNVPDGEYELVKAFQKNGYKAKLVKDFHNGVDAWRFEHENEYNHNVLDKSNETRGGDGLSPVSA